MSGFRVSGARRSAAVSWLASILGCVSTTLVAADAAAGSGVPWRVGQATHGEVPPEPLLEAIAIADRAIHARITERSSAEGLFEAFREGHRGDDESFRVRVDAVRRDLREARFAIDVREAPLTTLGAALAGFTAAGPEGRPLILVNRDLLAGSPDAGRSRPSSEFLAAILLEELGHALDHVINGPSDTPGDEGEAFSLAVLGLDASPAARRRIACEDDRRRITLAGRETVIEQATITFQTVYRTDLGESGQGFTPSSVLAGSSFRFTTDPPSAPTFEEARHGNAIPGTFTYLDPDGRSISFAGEIVRRTPVGSAMPTAVGFHTEESDDDGHDFIFAIGLNTLVPGTHYNTSANQIARRLDEYVAAQAPSAVNSSWSIEPTTLAADGIAAATVTVTVRNFATPAVPLAGASVVLERTGGVATIDGVNPAITGSDGRATFAVRSTVANVATFRVRCSRAGVEVVLANPSTIAVTFAASPSSRLAVIGQPTSGDSGVVLGTGFLVEVQDADGNRSTGDNFTAVTASIASGPAGAVLGGTLTQTASFGLATFDDLMITGPGGNYVLRFASPGLASADTAPIAICHPTIHYLDSDGDGFGGVNAQTFCSEPGPDWSTRPGDCDDGRASVNPAAPEICNGNDDDCDAAIDEDLVFTDYYFDVDGDGYGSGTSQSRCADPGSGWTTLGGDCDDALASINPAASETCNGLDDDCDSSIDDGLVFTDYFVDSDGDGYGWMSAEPFCSDPGPGWSTQAGDCDDGDPTRSPGASESCNGRDDDCDGSVDEDLTFSIYYQDLDGDGFSGANPEVFCADPGAGWSTAITDCNDANAAISPAAAESCNSIDDDCDDLVDEDLAFIDYYADVDGDGYGGTAAGTLCADPGPGWTSTPGDCDDALASVNPAAAESCNGLDDDCDGAIDDGVVFTDWYADSDGDGYGWMSAEPFCSDPGPGWSTQAGDCDDGDPSRNPGAAETCNGRDDDCDGSVDEDLAFTIYYQDLDGDGFSGANPEVFCADPGAGWSTAITDCNDANAAISPAAAESCNSIDDDCDDLVDENLAFIDYYVDGDGDGYGGTAAETLCADPGPGWTSMPGDCDDALASINPAAAESCNGLDDDCDSSIDDGLVFTDWYLDADGDGSGDPAVSRSACSPPDGYVADSSDRCPADPAKIAPGDCGCGTADVDVDGSGVSDCLEAPDTDGDGVNDPLDGCPDDPGKTEPGICGCGVADVDENGVWHLDCLEGVVPPAFESRPVAGIVAGDEFGAAIAADGDRVAIGLPGDDHSGRTDAGSVRILRRDGSAWIDEGELLAPSPLDGERFGAAVALHGDVAVVGRPSRSFGGIAEAGATEIYRRDAGGAWLHEATLTRATPVAADRFGASVAAHAGLVAVGAPFADAGNKSNAGEVTIFRFVNGGWTATGAITGAPATAGDRFGSAVAFGGESPRILVSGCPGDDETGKANCGALYVHEVASTGAITPRARLVGAAVADRQLGESAAVSGDGRVVAAGAPGADAASGVDVGLVVAWEFRATDGAPNGSPAAWIGFSLAAPGPQPGERFGHSIAIDRNAARIAVGSPPRTRASIVGRGSATIFQRRGHASWDQAARLDDAAGGGSASRFGSAVAFHGGFPLVGGPFHDPPAGGAVVRFDTLRDCVGDDSDADGMGDACDACPLDPTKIWGEQCGCGNPETDSDSDGTADCRDLCPFDAAKVAPGTCGCGTSDVDADSDGLADCLDPDDDGDGTADASDGCPFDPAKTAPGLCGCGASDADADADLTPDCFDGCTTDPLKTDPGTCGCGVADVDSDGDELVDCLGGGLLAEREIPAAPTLSNGDDYGHAIAVDGDTAVIGLPGRDFPGKVDAGTAAVLVRSAGTWSVSATLAAADSRKGDAFGLAVAISGDLIAVGAPLADVAGTKDAGAVYLYRRSGTAWSQEAKLLRATRATNDRFGEAVAARGEFVAVGCPFANGGAADTGEVVVFGRESLVWSPRSNLTLSPATAGDRFGQSVALGGDAATPVLAAGAPGDDEAGLPGCGAVVVHCLDAVGLSTASTRLMGLSPSPNAALGSSVAIDGSGLRVAAGAPLANVAGIGAKAGLVTVWRATAGTWTTATLAPAGQSADEQFGSCVAFSPDGTVLVAGSPLRTIGGIAGRGAATLFILHGGAWSTYDRLTLSAAGPGVSNLGRSGAFAGGTVLIGAPKHGGKGTVREFAVPSAP